MDSLNCDKNVPLIYKLEKDAWFPILNFCDHKTITYVERVSKQFYNYVKENYWKERIKDFLPSINYKYLLNANKDFKKDVLRLKKLVEKIKKLVEKEPLHSNVGTKTKLKDLFDIYEKYITPLEASDLCGYIAGNFDDLEILKNLLNLFNQNIASTNERIIGSTLSIHFKIKELINELIKADELEDASYEIKDLENQAMKDGLYLELSKAYANKELIKKAMELKNKISDKKYQDEALFVIVKKCCTQSNFSAKKIQNTYDYIEKANDKTYKILLLFELYHAFKKNTCDISLEYIEVSLEEDELGKVLLEKDFSKKCSCSLINRCRKIDCILQDFKNIEPFENSASEKILSKNSRSMRKILKQRMLIFLGSIFIVVGFVVVVKKSKLLGNVKIIKFLKNRLLK